MSIFNPALLWKSGGEIVARGEFGVLAQHFTREPAVVKSIEANFNLTVGEIAGAGHGDGKVIPAEAAVQSGSIDNFRFNQHADSSADKSGAKVMLFLRAQLAHAPRADLLDARRDKLRH